MSREKKTEYWTRNASDVMENLISIWSGVEKWNYGVWKNCEVLTSRCIRSHRGYWKFISRRTHPNIRYIIVNIAKKLGVFLFSGDSIASEKMNLFKKPWSRTKVIAISVSCTYVSKGVSALSSWIYSVPLPPIMKLTDLGNVNDNERSNIILYMAEIITTASW